MSVDLEARPAPAPTQSSPTFRQTGFSVPPTSTSSTQDVNATASGNTAHKAPRGKLSSSSLNAALHARSHSGTVGRAGGHRTSTDDGDAEMTDAGEMSSYRPLPIPGKTAAIALVSKTSQSPSDLATPPDAMALTSHKQSPGLSTSGVRLPPLNSNLISPRFSTMHGSSVSSGPASATSSHWSPGRSSDPHLYSISSGRKYSYTTFKPSLSTSFKMSAERGRSSNTFDDDDDDDDDDDERFGKRSSGALGLVSDGKAAGRAATAEAGEDGDASGVFSFSSPCFGPKQLDNDQIPSPDPSEQLPAASGSGPAPSGVLSPSWATASLGKLSLGSPEARTTISSQLRRGSRPQHSHSYGQTNHGGNMSTSADVAVHAAMQQRRYSYNKAARPSLSSGPSSYTYSTSFGRDSALNRHPYPRSSMPGSYGASSYRASRSRSRTRHGPEDARASSRLEDDDETDEEMQLDEDDDDATEDEADYAYARHQAGRSAYGRSIPRAVNDRSRSNTPSNASLGLTFSMSPSSNSILGKGLPYDSGSRSASFGVSLSRQYSSDRHPPGASLAPHRHHPYATSPNGATTGPLSASMGLSYSPGSNAPLNRPAHRRGSSLGNGLAAPGYGGTMLSTSPRYANGVPHRDEQQLGEGGAYLGQPSFASGSPFAAGQRMDSAGKYYTPAPGSSYGHAQAHFASRNGGLAQSPPGRLPPDRLGQIHAGFGAHERSDSMASEATEGPDSGVRPSVPPTTTASASARSNSNTGASGNVDETAQVAAIRDRLGGAASCSAFISKLWLLMINPDLYSKYIRWDEAGTSIILSSEPEIANEFASDVLPKLFKHGNNASFVRQLNLYGFQRIPSSRLLDPTEIKVAAARRAAESGGAGAASAGTLNTAVQLYGPHSSFAHPRFRRGHEELLTTMKPRSSKKPKKSNGSATTGLSPPKQEAGAGAAGGAGRTAAAADGDETDEEDFALS
ncbi:uncharacterized protein PFL1_06342 [Pseudozyma flocculosa PF-1]|uniref:HSF-type DNA-binding domain-containing protein n=2 Tax=Pseudozyma flocculosa TaxID=84751 RepID=A0A5C3FAC2_9BASI|nr:uncharacterized protein PFL1_06342 [Pseudozyma flocculosa PF-1]EPQ26134.1 hypothetical protein PFL1_06342 [Pseudozyma flocculosa PF-1]SPO40381.1 uncharacterized protein PSFLO_05863 [Pseudozyma flocculosa]